MKFDPQKSFGYPVLRQFSEDYIGRTFEPELRLKRAVDGSALEIHYDLHCSSEYLNSLVRDEKAVFVVRVTCPQTFYEGMHITRIKKDVVVVPKEEIRHLVTLGAYIVAKTVIEDFSLDEFNSEFEGAQFEIGEGDVLACIEERDYYIGREVFENISSIFLLAVQDDLPDGIWTIDYESEKVSIRCNANQEKILNIASQRTTQQPIILASVILPAVIQLLDALITHHSDYCDKRWAQVILGRIQNEQLGHLDTSTDTLRLAQRLCDTPLIGLNEIFSAETA